MSEELQSLARTSGELLRARGWRLVAAESCTAGWIAKVVTDIEGSSEWFERGFVTYSNESKEEMLGVRRDTLHTWGAVSAQTVSEMASRALVRSHGQIAVAISGIAGPGGGTSDKPVGTVWIGWAVQGGDPEAEHQIFPGNRDEVRRAAVKRALEGVIERASP